MNKNLNFLKVFRKLKLITSKYLNYFRYFFIALFIIISSYSYIFFINDNCKSLKFFSAYKDLGIEDVNSMYKSGQLDMLLNNADSNKKTYVKFHHDKDGKLTAVTSKKLDEYIEDLFITENILTPDDNLIIITKDGANDTMISILKNKIV